MPTALTIYTAHLVICIYYPYCYLSIYEYLGTHKHILPLQLESMLLRNRDQNSSSAFSTSHKTPPLCKYTEILTTTDDNDEDMSKTILVISVPSEGWDNYGWLQAGYRDGEKETNPRVCSIIRVSIRFKKKKKNQLWPFWVRPATRPRISLAFWVKRYFKGIVNALVRDLC